MLFSLVVIDVETGFEGLYGVYGFLKGEIKAQLGLIVGRPFPTHRIVLRLVRIIVIIRNA
ncbi:hypothetical protein C7A10_31295 [Pseudomonas fluorescens]|uniref:Uncharacterized protein n=1 Tax=Pseudomonas fluorescens TaxID=294 RepID=A0A2T0HJ90_PSEFL|nr:hypothetical protein C7A10_31295 [Pseudomonas fluorescens]